MNNIDKIESEFELQKKISFWNNKLNNCKDPVECAILADKISEARNMIAKIRSKKLEQNITTQIDAPAMIDRIEQYDSGITPTNIVLNGDNSFKIII